MIPCPACGGSGKVKAEVCCNNGAKECCGGFVPGEVVCMRCWGAGRIKAPRKGGEAEQIHLIQTALAV